jgi:hypothetical protein
MSGTDTDSIVEALEGHGCEALGDGNLGTWRCSDSFVQKRPDKPWTLLVRSGGPLEELRGVLLDVGLGVSGAGLGEMEKQSGWSKMERFEVGRQADVHLFDEQMIPEEIEDDGVARLARRVRRLAKNLNSEAGGKKAFEIAQRELEHIAEGVERELEEAYTESLGGEVLCAARADSRRIWDPERGGDLLQYKVEASCLLPEESVRAAREEVEAAGERRSFKTVHKNGINSIVTPDERLFLRKVVLHDRGLGGPFLAFGVRDRNLLTSEVFMDELRALEGHLAHPAGERPGPPGDGI